MNSFPKILEGTENFCMADNDEESLLARHKKEQKALVAKVTALKKTATKGDKAKRKEVLSEIERLEKEMRDRHLHELEEFKNGDPYATRDVAEGEQHGATNGEYVKDEPPVQGMESLKLDESGVTNQNGKRKASRQKTRMVAYAHFSL